MRMSDGVEWSIHSCIALAALPPDRSLPSAKLAEFHGVPAAYLAKHLQAMARAGIVRAVAGRRGGYRLAKTPAEITLLDVVDAVEGGTPAFRCTEIRARGPVRGARGEDRQPCGVAAAMWEVEGAWRAALSRRTVAGLLADLGASVSEVTIRRGTEWLWEAMR
jgi:Rrf2 family protein